ncbi:flagellar motor stator protein MotA [Enterobacter ludwigii]|uniref:flagellar motor stator protein MotA n=1 Tax=Enterobacter ludwigii TaxID=299767 RepID=UPI003F70563D
MQKLLGFFFAIACVCGGYIFSGGKLLTLWAPGEIIIILGAAIGVMVLANTRSVLKEIFSQLLGIMKKNTLTEEYQRQLLMLLYELLELVQEGGLKKLDTHIETPGNSPLFQKYPLILVDMTLVTFISDNFRLMAMGKINEHELEHILDQELEVMDEYMLRPSRSLQRIAEAMPGFGICAAVLGIIITMESIDGSIADVGSSVAHALVGTFLGVFFCYCIIDPIASAMEEREKSKLSILECVRTVLVNHVAGKPTLLAVDAGRKMLPLYSKPTFARLEHWVNEMTGTN